MTKKQYKQRVQTTKERHGEDFYKKLGANSVGNRNSWLKGNSENASKAVKARWAKYRALKEQEALDEAREQMEEYNAQKGDL